METQEEGETMRICDKLQRKPLNFYDECNYVDTRESNWGQMEWYYDYGGDPIKSVDAVFYDMEYDMDENAMEKFVLMITGMLFQIDKGVVEADLAYGTNYDINDFKTGEYDDLFTPEDLKLLKADIKTIEDYLSKHPELLEE